MEQLNSLPCKQLKTSLKSRFLLDKFKAEGFAFKFVTQPTISRNFMQEAWTLVIAKNDLRNLAFPHIFPPECVNIKMAHIKQHRMPSEASAGTKLHMEGRKKFIVFFLLRWNVYMKPYFDSLL